MKPVCLPHKLQLALLFIQSKKYFIFSIIIIIIIIIIQMKER